jgi:hypothetical protein
VIGLVPPINDALVYLALAAGVQGAPTPAPTAPTGTTPPSASAPAFNILDVLQFGLLGLIFLCVVLKRFVVPEWTLRDTEKRLDATREQLEALQQTFEQQMIPALTRATEVNARYTDELQRARYLGQQIGRAQERGPGVDGQ